MSVIGIDIETNDTLSPYDDGAEILTVALYGDGIGVVYPWGQEAVNHILFLNEHGAEFCAHNAKFEKKWFEYHGVKLNVVHCTMLMHYLLVLDTELHSLEYCSQFASMRKLKKPKSDDLEALMQYNMGDAVITFDLFTVFKERMLSAGVWQYYLDIELPYIDTLVEMEAGIHVDMEYFHRYKASVLERRHKLWCELAKQAPVVNRKIHEFKQQVLSHTENGQPVFTNKQYKDGVSTYRHCTFEYWNPGSPDQKIKVLKEHGWEPKTYTKTGKPSTDKYALAECTLPIAQLLRQYSSLDNTITGTLNPIEQRVTSDNIVRGNFNQCKTNTLRLSSSEPNLQNIPARGEKGSDIRKIFTARPGHKLVVGDLDRIEVCVLAFYLEAMFGDTTYSDAVRNGEDVHALNAANWGIERSPAKNGLFSWIYGAQVEKFAAVTGLSVHKAKLVFQRMEEMNPALFEYREFCEREALENHGRVYNWMGGMHYIPDILSPERYIQAAGKRKVSNYVIQGSAASIFKYLQVQPSVRDACRRAGARLVLVVHDESVYEAPEETADQLATELTECYTTNTLLAMDDFYVPVSATFHTGHNWMEAKAG